MWFVYFFAEKSIQSIDKIYHCNKSSQFLFSEDVTKKKTEHFENVMQQEDDYSTICFATFFRKMLNTCNNVLQHFKRDNATNFGYRTSFQEDANIIYGKKEWQDFEK